ncbi:MAG: T9SS type A sorting domain-containing protein, partial [Chlorobi bacterium]|nr:T9SS type A sorting domain-containing protein [Chlorobiota bacterium]
GCWLYDTINVGIHPGFSIDIGVDTTIRENDTIIFSIPDEFEFYSWSDGSSSNKITITGSDYGVGTFPVWVEVADGPCFETDTIILTIKSEFGIEEKTNRIINIYPNPFEETFTVEIKPEYQIIEVLDLNGIRLFTKDLEQTKNTEQIRLNNLTNGVYILKNQTKENNLIRKIIKL